MGILKQLLGVGGATVDTVIANPTAKIAEKVEGVVNIKGGQMQQTISRVEIELKTDYVVRHDGFESRHEINLLQLVVGTNVAIQPGQDLQIPFSFFIPFYTPVDINARMHWGKVWVETELEIPRSTDPEDRDLIKILPTDTMDIIHKALKMLGFKLGEVEYYPKYMGHYNAMPQSFEYKPNGKFYGKLDEIEVLFLPNENGVDLKMEIERKSYGARGRLAERFNMDESHIKLHISNEQANQGADFVANLLENEISKYSF